MLLRAVRIASIAGIELRLDPSMLLIVAFVVWSFTERFTEDHPLGLALGMATAFALLFFATILAHELAHALEARHRGIEVSGITLLLFGGVTEMHAHSPTPRDEFVVAAVGPYVSLVCGAIFGLLATFAGDLLPAAAAGPVAEVAGLLGWWNVLLALFNLVPGAPLDGGRVLRAALWWLLRDRLRAVRATVRVGQALGLVLIALGVWTFAQAPAAILAAGLLVLIGWFLFAAARKELAQAELEDTLAGRTVADLVGELPQPLPADRPLDLVDARALARGAALLPVVDDDRLVGVIEVEALETLHPSDRSVRVAGDLAEPVADLPSVDLTDDLHTMLERFQGDHHVVRLTWDGRDVGAITEREMARALSALRGRERAGWRAFGGIRRAGDVEVGS